MFERECESPRRGSSDGRTIGRRTILGASLAGLAGARFAGTAVSQDDLPNELTIVCLGDGVEYAFEVDGRVEFGDEAGDSDEIEGDSTVVGRINGRGRDNYEFSGDVVAFEISEGADDTRIVLDGEEVDPEDLGSGDVDVGEARTEETPYAITVRALTDEVEYELAVDGVLQQDGSGVDVEDDYLAGGTIEEGDEHAYSFWGIALVLEISAGVAAFSVELADDGSTAADRLPHRLFVRGLDDVVTYRFSVSDALELGDAAEDRDTDIPADERVDANTVEGHVHAHDGDPLTDDYRFSGSLEFERAEGPVRVRVKPNDERDDEEPSDARE